MIGEHSYRIDQIDLFGYRKCDGGAEHKQVGTVSDLGK